MVDGIWFSYCNLGCGFFNVKTNSFWSGVLRSFRFRSVVALGIERFKNWNRRIFCRHLQDEYNCVCFHLTC